MLTLSAVRGARLKGGSPPEVTPSPLAERQCPSDDSCCRDLCPVYPRANSPALKEPPMRIRRIALGLSLPLAACAAALWLEPFARTLDASAGPAPNSEAQVLYAADAPLPPERVVSMNLCTDQLAMLLAAPGQLISVSALARDPLSSAMAEAALSYPANHGLAEEIFLLRPDLVLTEPYTRPATVALLRQLGIRVELIQPVETLSQIGEALMAVGTALGREDTAAAARLAFEHELAALRAPAFSPSAAPRAAIYHANGYTTGAETLGGDILSAAGLANITEDFGMSWGGFLPLEQLVMAAPEVVISGQPYPGRSRSEDVLSHPALAALKRDRASATARDGCSTPKASPMISALPCSAYSRITRS